MMMTLRKRRGVCFIKGKGERIRDKGSIKAVPHFILSPLPFILAGSAVNGGGDEDRDADYQRADDDREGIVLVLLDLFLDREWGDQNDDQKRDRKNDQTDQYEDERRHEHRQEVVEFDPQPENG